MANKITHIELSSSNIGASAEFYRQLFDWDIQVFQEPMEYTMASLGEDAASVGFNPVSEEFGNKDGDALVYVGIDDIDATIAHAKELGATVLQDKMEIPGVGWMAVFSDPGGGQIAVMQWVRPE